MIVVSHINFKCRKRVRSITEQLFAVILICTVSLEISALPLNKLTESQLLNCFYSAIHRGEAECIKQISHDELTLVAVKKYDVHEIDKKKFSIWLSAIGKSQSEGSEGQYRLLSLEFIAQKIGSGIEVQLLSKKIGKDNLPLHAVLRITDQSILSEKVFYWLAITESGIYSELELFINSEMRHASLQISESAQLRGASEIKQWVLNSITDSNHLTHYPESIRVSPLEDGHFQVLIITNWTSRDKQNRLIHGRKQLSWIFEKDTDSGFQIITLKITDELPQPNMGTRVFC